MSFLLNIFHRINPFAASHQPPNATLSQLLSTLSSDTTLSSSDRYLRDKFNELYKGLYNEESTSDYCIAIPCTSGYYHIFVHKTILRAQSSFFREIFEKEKGVQSDSSPGGASKDTDSDSSTASVFTVPREENFDFEVILEILYGITTNFNLSAQNCIRFYKLAQKYGVKALLEECRAYVWANINSLDWEEMVRLLTESGEDVALLMRVLSDHRCENNFVPTLLNILSWSDFRRLIDNGNLVLSEDALLEGIMTIWEKEDTPPEMRREMLSFVKMPLLSRGTMESRLRQLLKQGLVDMEWFMTLMEFQLSREVPADAHVVSQFAPREARIIPADLPSKDVLIGRGRKIARSLTDAAVVHIPLSQTGVARVKVTFYDLVPAGNNLRNTMVGIYGGSRSDLFGKWISNMTLINKTHTFSSKNNSVVVVVDHAVNKFRLEHVRGGTLCEACTQLRNFLFPPNNYGIYVKFGAQDIVMEVQDLSR